MRLSTHTVSGAIAALAILLCNNLIAGDFEIARSTIDGGGEMRSADGDFELSGTIGQPDAGFMLSSEGVFELSGGFWFE